MAAVFISFAPFYMWVHFETVCHNRVKDDEQSYSELVTYIWHKKIEIQESHVPLGRFLADLVLQATYVRDLQKAICFQPVQLHLDHLAGLFLWNIKY